MSNFFVVLPTTSDALRAALETLLLYNINFSLYYKTEQAIIVANDDNGNSCYEFCKRLFWEELKHMQYKVCPVCASKGSVFCSHTTFTN